MQTSLGRFTILFCIKIVVNEFCGVHIERVLTGALKKTAGCYENCYCRLPSWKRWR